MRHLILILALIQAPTPTPVPLTYQNDPARPIAIWKDDGKGGIWTNVKPLPTPKAAATPKFLTVLNGGAPPPILFQENGRTFLTVADADIPVGPCNLGDLVRAAQAHITTHDAEDQDDTELSSRVTSKVYGGILMARFRAVKNTIAPLRAELARCSPAKGVGK